MRVARRCLVSGRVQGVFYRASARERARDLDVAGHAINLPDGRVEVLVIGDITAVTALIDWLWAGPPAAHVQDVAVEELDPGTVAAAADRFITR
jgi:acylphosphatase